MDATKRIAVKRPYEMINKGLDAEAGPTIEDNKASLKTLLDQESLSKDPTGELTKRVRSLEGKLEANTKMLEANTRELAKSTLQVSKLTALLQLFLKGKAKDVGVEVSFPIPNIEALAAVEFKINPGTKDAYIKTITDLLKNNTLPKSIKNVLAEPLICDFNIDGVNGKKALRTFPEFFSVLINSIGMLGQQPPEKALAHALSCVKNNASKKMKKSK